jgi:hypothetical protein
METGPKSVLQAPIFTNYGSALPKELEQALLDRFWPLPGPHPTQQDPDELSAYFTYVQQECRPALAALHAMRTFEDMVSILDVLRDNPAARLVDIVVVVGHNKATLASDEDKLFVSIELVIDSRGEVLGPSSCG